MSCSAVAREIVMQHPDGIETSAVCDQVGGCRRTVERALQYHAEQKHIRREGTVCYPADGPTGYYLDRVLVWMAESPYKWSAISNMAYRVPMAPSRLRDALRGVESLGLVRVSEDGQHACIDEKGASRVPTNGTAADIVRKKWI